MGFTFCGPDGIPKIDKKTRWALSLKRQTVSWFSFYSTLADQGWNSTRFNTYNKE